MFTSFPFVETIPWLRRLHGRNIQTRSDLHQYRQRDHASTPQEYSAPKPASYPTTYRQTRARIDVVGPVACFSDLLAQNRREGDKLTTAPIPHIQDSCSVYARGARAGATWMGGRVFRYDEYAAWPLRFTRV